jgi:hypothetical protein
MANIIIPGLPPISTNDPSVGGDIDLVEYLQWFLKTQNYLGEFDGEPPSVL